jgi:enoyl-CoA hydratase/carnithine racemase
MNHGIYTVSGTLSVGLGYEMMSIRSPDHAEGIAAFEERRKPKFGAQK